jgi:hypothetical protein
VPNQVARLKHEQNDWAHHNIKMTNKYMQSSASIDTVKFGMMDVELPTFVWF